MSIKFLIENELAKAEGVLAAKDLVDRVQKALEDINEMRVKDLPDLAESLGTAFEADVVQGFVDTVNTAMETLISSLEEARNSLDSASKTLTGEEAPEVPAMDTDSELGSDDGEEDQDGEDFDDFNMTPAAAGGDIATGRPQRESADARRALLIKKMTQIHESLKKLRK